MRQSKICNCQISSNKDIFKSGCNQSFCNKCGCVLLKDTEGNIFYTLKAKQNRFSCDLSPIIIIKNMKKKTEEEYPFIYQEFNVNKADKYIKDKELKSINLYLKKRKMLLLKLQKLMKEFDYCDKVFYQCLFYLDTYLSHNITEDFSDKKFLYYLIGYFLCSSKFKETDIYEPSFDAFYDLSRGIYLSIDKIAYYEALCLKEINYNVFSYSAYDWACQIMANGIVFNCEIDKDNEIIIINGHRHLLINTINKFIIKMILNLTGKSLFFKYAPMYLAFSLIQISREKFLDKAIIKPKLFSNLVNAYGINPEDYKDCYDEVIKEIKESSNQENDINKKRNAYNIDQNQINNELNSDERTESTKKSSFNSYKSIYVPTTKIRSSNALIHVNANLLANNLPTKDDNKEINTENIKEEKVFSKEIDSNKKYKLKLTQENKISNIKTKQRLSIDCSVNNFKSNTLLKYTNIETNPNYKESYPFMTINEEKSETNHSRNLSLNKKGKRPSLKELKHIRPNQHNRYNSLSSKNFNTIGNIDEKEEKESNNERKELKKKSKFFSNKNIDYGFNNNIEITKNNKFTSKQLPKIKVIEEDANDKTKKRNEEKNRTINLSKSKNKFKLKTSIKITLPENEKK